MFSFHALEVSYSFTDVAVISNLSIHVKAFYQYIILNLMSFKTELQVEKALVVDGSDGNPDVQDPLFFEGR